MSNLVKTGKGKVVEERDPRLASDSEFEQPENVQKPGKEDTLCIVCQKDFPSNYALKHHITQFHKGQYLYKCEECGKGFMSRTGVKTHMISHQLSGTTQEERNKQKPYQCELCADAEPPKVAGFTTERAYRGHLKIYHPEEGSQTEFACPHCNKVFISKANMVQHRNSCKKNPARKELYCEICPEGAVGRGPYYNLNKLMEHKRKVHGWRPKK